ncbi:MAG: IS701 family transposase [Actinomycetota bacterium]|nr:IS701 family transposase [Actinomycetota bacterium]
MTGLAPGELSRVRDRLVDFAEEMLSPLARKDQRRWGEVYLRGLMLDGRRKSIEPMAARLADGDEQCLQQFVNQSPWRWEPVLGRLAVRMSSEIVPEAWVLDDTAFPKFGRQSVGVARQYCGALGKVGNCQIGVSVSAVTAQASCPLNWRLFLPEEWDDDPRRVACRVPDQVAHEAKWKLGLSMVDELRGWGLVAPVVLGDAAYGDITEFRLGLQEREISYVLDVKGSTSALAEDGLPERPAYVGAGRRPAARYRPPFSTLAALASSAGPQAAQEVCWREGTRGKMSSRFLALRVRPANVKLRRADPDGELPTCWLLVEWPAGKDTPTDYWLSNLPIDTPIERLVELAKLRWRIEQDYRELKDALGLDHFEGRSWPGWHHHVTLVSIAHGFLTSERLHRPPLRAAA